MQGVKSAEAEQEMRDGGASGLDMVAEKMVTMMAVGAIVLTALIVLGLIFFPRTTIGIVVVILVLWGIVEIGNAREVRRVRRRHRTSK